MLVFFVKIDPRATLTLHLKVLHCFSTSRDLSHFYHNALHHVTDLYYANVFKKVLVFHTKGKTTGSFNVKNVKWPYF